MSTSPPNNRGMDSTNVTTRRGGQYEMSDSDDENMGTPLDSNTRIQNLGNLNLSEEEFSFTRQQILARRRRLSNASTQNPVTFRDSLTRDQPNSNLASANVVDANAVVSTLIAPELKSLDPKAAIEFLEKREEYEAQAADISSTNGVSVATKSWKLSVKRSLLKTLYMMGEFEQIAPGISYSQLTSEHDKGQGAINSTVKDKFQVNSPWGSVKEIIAPYHTQHKYICKTGKTYYSWPHYIATHN